MKLSSAQLSSAQLGSSRSFVLNNKNVFGSRQTDTFLAGWWLDCCVPIFECVKALRIIFNGIISIKTIYAQMVVNSLEKLFTVTFH